MTPHALQAVLKVRFPSLAGTRVSRDFVGSLHSARDGCPPIGCSISMWPHHSSGEPIPAALLQRLRDSATFNSGITMVQYLSTALLDLRVHLLEQLPGTVESVEQQFREELGMPDALAMRFGLAQFQHIFSSTYAAGYYSYRWADALTADAAEYFAQHTGFRSRSGKEPG